MCDLLRSIFILMQCILYEHLIQEIIDIFVDLELYFRYKFQHRICYKQFFRKYHYKVVIIMTVCFLYISSFFFRLIFDKNTVGMPGVLYKMLQIMSTISYCYPLFFAELLNYHLNQLNLVIRKDLVRISILINKREKQMEVVQRLKCYKIVHFRLWMVNQRINKYFGYSIIAIFLHSFTDTVYSIFTGYERINSNYLISSMWSII